MEKETQKDKQTGQPTGNGDKRKKSKSKQQPM
jgi:hypothetical protein